ncbi:MAG TPA: M13 family metallopeptidase [Candidatus Angelobacter sp.]|nr:M13 family metallopeptidase [Candidatus Angelobacter sp.]
MNRNSASRFSLFLGFLLPVFFFISAATAQQSRSTEQTSAEPALPYSPSLDVGSLDKSIDPCVDFYQYSCGGWQKKNPIPADQAGWSVYGKLYEDNLAFLRGILEQAAAGGQRDQVTQEVGDFYAACVDEKTVEKRGLEPIQPELSAIAELKSSKDLAPLVARLQLLIPDGSIIFGGGSQQDPDDSERQIAGLFQGGLGLPDRDYYTNQDKKSKETRVRYVQHVQKIFELLGDSPETAKKNAATVMRMEMALAKASLTRVDLRDPYKLKNKMTPAELEQLAPAFDWKSYFQAIQAPQLEVVNLSSRQFLQEVNRQAKAEPVANWKTYFRFHVGDALAPFLTSKFVQENFEFSTKYLRGAKELKPRWKRCVQYEDGYLGEALGQAYVHRVFSPELKADTLDMVKRIEIAMEQRIRQLDWMDADTKQQALTKLHSIRNKIGYPDKWRDYSSIKITRDDFAGNISRASEFEARRQINKIGQPVDHGEWGMTPPTVDAYFNAQMNDINFPAGVLQPPLYDQKMDAAPNYGNTGGTIGHELTHGFDDEGRQFDSKGNLKDWWTKEDAKKFEARAKCVDDQYSQYIAVDEVHVNGKLTLGENVADLGGEILAYIAWQDATKDKNLQPVDGLTPEQRFFIGFAQWDCANSRPEDERLRALTDPHSPPRHRINGVVVNMPEFAKVFSCKSGQPMVKPADKVCRVW